jgi:2-phospho-L-lactate guanylyltransferase
LTQRAKKNSPHSEVNASFRGLAAVGALRGLRYIRPVRYILIAAKHLAFAKTRLAPTLAEHDRRILAQAMFRDVLAASLGSRRADRVAVVTSDPGLLAMAREAGALTLDEEYPRGLNAAVAMATDILVSADATEICTVLSDIPLVTARDLDNVFDALSPSRGAVLVPSRDFTGTNIIARAPGGVIPTLFGRMSLVKHLEECRRAEVSCEILRQNGPALDLDLMADLLEFVRTAGPTNTLNELARLGLASN